MGRFKRVYLFAGLLLFPALLFAQFNNTTTSPYSRFGLGDLSSQNVGRTFAMGGASLASRNPLQINIANPASYSAIDSLNFLFEFGVSAKGANFKNENSKMSANDVNFWYLSMGFPITNWMGTSLGLKPFSNVGYEVGVNGYLENTGDYFLRYFGDGSLSKAYFGLAVEPLQNLSFGANINYLFGTLRHNAEEYFTGAPDYYSTQKSESLRFRGFSLDMGLQATFPLKNNNQLTVAATFTNETKFTAFKSDIIQKYLSSSVAADVDTLNFQDEEKGKANFPLSYGLGLSFVKENMLEINMDYLHQSWSKATFFGEPNSFLTDMDRVALGAEWIPERLSIQSYFARVAYRVGVKYENSYLIINDQQIKDFGISFGVGLPIYNSNSTINVSAELGKRGTTRNNLIEEDYVKLNLSVNLHSFWFMKQKFD